MLNKLKNYIFIIILLSTGCKNVFSGAALLDNAPPRSPALFTVKAGSQMASLAWTNPVDADFSGVKIIMKLNKYPDTVIDGDSVQNVLSNSCVINYVNKETFYKVFTYDKESSPNISNGVPAVVLFDTPCEIPGVDADCCN